MDGLAPFTRVLPGLVSPPRSIRSSRYRGDDRAVRLSAIDANEREAIRELYRALTKLEDDLSRLNPGDEGALTTLASSFELDRVLRATRTLGRRAGAADDERQALHDVRGGALTSLLIELQRVCRGRSEDGMNALEVLTSDHLKIMRNAVLELDDARRAADSRPCPHAVTRLAESLARVTGASPAGATRVEVRCDFSGAITMSCVELGALDRAALNLVNNAARHSVADTVNVWLVPVVEEPSADLRLLVGNRLDPAQLHSLHDRFGDDLSRLFVESHSTTGSGEGLKICVRFVAAAFGLVRPADAVESGLVGALVADDWFIAWLHWPSVA